MQLQLDVWFMMLKYKWGIGKTQWFKAFPFVIVAINILIAVCSDFESAIRGAHALAETGTSWWLSSEIYPDPGIMGIPGQTYTIMLMC